MSIYDFRLADAHGEIVDFSTFRNKVVVIVNVASLCGFAPQYHDLQYLYNKYEDLEIIAFPSNQFAHQEPESDEVTERNTRSRFGVTFPIMKKVLVNGRGESPVYTFLKKEQLNEFGFKGVKWNFEKFVIDRNGNVVRRIGAGVNPRDFEGYLQDLLGIRGDEQEAKK